MAEARISILISCLLCWFLLCCAAMHSGDECIDSRQRSGVCTQFRDCASVREDLKKGIRPMHCGFAGFEPIVCCPSMTSTLISTSLPQPPVTSPPARKPGERAREWCFKYSEPCPFVITVVGGSPALPDEFPHMAAIGYGPQDNIQWSCGGSLISESFVLTAAHCLHGGQSGPARWVLLGTVNLAANESFLGDTGQIHAVVRRIRHPGYRPPAKYDDVALLQIGPAVTKNPRSLLSEKLHPACLRRDDISRQPSYIATGWGRVGYGEDPSLELLKVELDVFDEAKCNETFETEIRTTNQLRRGIDSTMMCAGILRGGKDTCQGDSGGPLQYATSGKCQYEIWGITSFGKICSFANSPSVYMKVSAYIEWIEDNVWPS